MIVGYRRKKFNLRENDLGLLMISQNEIVIDRRRRTNSTHLIEIVRCTEYWLRIA